MAPCGLLYFTYRGTSLLTSQVYLSDTANYVIKCSPRESDYTIEHLSEEQLGANDHSSQALRLFAF
jgi:hypothetical protein